MDRRLHLCLDCGRLALRCSRDRGRDAAFAAGGHLDVVEALGLGNIERIDFTAGTIALTTPVERDKVRIIQFGDVYVTPEGGELGQVKWTW